MHERTCANNKCTYAKRNGCLVEFLQKNNTKKLLRRNIMLLYGHIHPCKHTHALLSSPTLSLSCRHDSSRSPIKSHSPDVSFAHNSKESRRSRTKSRSPDSSSRHSKILEDLGRADIFGPLSGDPHDRPIATVGISLGNTHTNTHKQINTRLFVMGYEHGNFKKFIS